MNSFERKRSLISISLVCLNVIIYVISLQAVDYFSPFFSLFYPRYKLLYRLETVYVLYGTMILISLISLYLGNKALKEDYTKIKYPAFILSLIAFIILIVPAIVIVYQIAT